MKRYYQYNQCKNKNLNKKLGKPINPQLKTV